MRKFTIDRELIEREIDYWRIPGAAIAVFGDGMEDATECFGFRNVAQGLPWDEDTLHCVASCSKSMTSLLIARLVDEGRLDYDRPLREYLPEFGFWDRETAERCTLRDLLCHRTGLGGYDAQWPSAVPRSEMVKMVRWLEPTDSFRRRSQYSNFIYTLIGYVAEAVTGRDWHELMKDYVFRPLGMDRTCSRRREICSDSDWAAPYYVTGSGLTEVPFWDIDNAGPAASVCSTIGDMATYVKFHIAGGLNGDGERLLEPETFAEMHAPQIAYSQSTGLPGDIYGATSYCMGWMAGGFRGRSFQKHTGKIEGYSTLMMYFPEERKGLVIMMNLHTPSDQFQYGVAYTLLDRLFGTGDRNWCLSFRGREAKAPADKYLACNMDTAAGRLDPQLRGQELPRRLGAYEGRYFNPGFGPVTLRIGRPGEHLRNPGNSAFIDTVPDSPGGTLLLRYRDQELPLEHYGGDSFVMAYVKEDTWTMRVNVSFEANPHGEVDKVYIGYEPMLRDIAFIRQERMNEHEL